MPVARRIDAVLPVGRETPLLDGCLERLAHQTRPPDVVIVVDDSADGSVAERPGVRTLRSGGRGPYAARNLGWRSSTADVVLFVDERSRPGDRWAELVGGAFEDPSVILASTDVRVRGGPTLAEQTGQRHRFFRREVYTRPGLFRTYGPTCNLAVRRAALESVEGFREVRSSADIDLCWRLLGDPALRMEHLDDVLMEWVPRDRLRDYFEQCHRYGRAHRALYAEWRDVGGPDKVPESYGVLAYRGARLAARMGRAALVRRSREEVVKLLWESGLLTYELGYRRGPPAPRASS